MKKLAVYVAMLVLLSSATPTIAQPPFFTWSSPQLGEMTMPNAECRHEVVFCMFVASERYDVRAAYGWPSGFRSLGEPHTQAQAKVGESWVWLTMVDRECQFGSQDVFDNWYGKDKPFFIGQYLSLKEYIKWMYVWSERERLNWTLNQEKGK